MSVAIKNKQLPESPELKGEISIDEIEKCIKKTNPSLNQSDVLNLVHSISAIIGYKDNFWDEVFKKRLQNLYSNRPLHLID
ncbi:hypothetical protein K8354_16235 [Polaribacter litorisediminis]|uniref:hypothetical protein n=1 Tax=Polaribacter litorisediminis TaxID=1908341 RepID=UPI001CBC1012|nr:hypothetical protein [Polaribacter litorisediminis]UAM97819.1 hypothetical protein K8354_16235 [Polaribacter litorisediminis]